MSFASTAIRFRSSWRIWLTMLIIAISSIAIVKWFRYIPLNQEFRSDPIPFLIFIDSRSYLAMAEGQVAQVESPFPKRMLHPWMVRKVADALKIEISVAFVAMNIFSILLLTYVVASILRVIGVNPLWGLLLLLTPFPLESLELAYLSDLFHMALVALFFLLLLTKRNVSALVVLFIAFVARESTLLLGLGCGWLAWRRREKSLLVGTCAVVIAGMACSSALGRLGLPNVHKLPDFVYLALKVPYNSLLNIFGVGVWSNVKHDIGVPLVKWALPPSLQFSAYKEVGLCFFPKNPLNTALIFLSIFGVGPLFLFRAIRALRGKWRQLNVPFAIELSLLYGTVAFVSGPMLGAWTERLIGYGWPAFWIGLPYLLARTRFQFRRQDAVFLLAFHVVITWLPRVVGTGWREVRFLPPVLVLCIIAAVCLRRSRWLDSTDTPAGPLGEPLRISS